MMSRRKWPIHQALTKGRLKNRTSSILCGPHSVRKAKTPRSWKILENQISIVRLGAKIYSPAQNKMTWWVCRREKECKNWWCLIPSLRKTNSNLWDSLGLSCRMMRWLLAVVKQRGDTSCSSLLLGEWQRNSTKKLKFSVIITQTTKMTTRDKKDLALWAAVRVTAWISLGPR